MGAYIIDDYSSIMPEDVNELIAELPCWRREKALAINHSQGRKECVLSYLLLKEALKEEYNIDGDLQFEYSEHGKPSLKYFPDYHFSFSHCKSSIACIVGRQIVGIDIERRGRYKPTLANHVLNDEELTEVNNAKEPDLVFAQYWTKKEAVLKLTGEGVSSSMKDVISMHPEIKLSTFYSSEYVCSIATLC